MNPGLDIIENGIVIVEKNLIKDIGEAKDLKKKYKTQKVIDIGNGIVMPGLINTHTHAAMAYFRGLADDLPLKEWLEEHIWPAEGKFVSPGFVKKSSGLACLEMIKSGTTCFNDMYFFERETAKVAESIGIRIVIGEGVLNFPTPSCKIPDEAIKATLDLAKDFKKSELITVCLAPHSIYTCDKELLVKISNLAKEIGSLIHIHAGETKKEVADCKEEYKKSPVEYLDNIGLLGENVVAAHSVWLDNKDLEIYKKRGVKVSHNPVSNMKLASGIMPLSEMIEKGITVGLGTDGAASNNTLDLFFDIRVCALLHKVDKLDPTVVNARQVMKMATIDGARVLGLDDKIGSLETGKRADIITINLDKPHLTPIHDPFSHLVYCVNGRDVEDVIINGKVVMQNRVVKTIDEERILKEAKKFKI